MSMQVPKLQPTLAFGLAGSSLHPENHSSNGIWWDEPASPCSYIFTIHYMIPVITIP